jgi:phage terminase small subunit
MARSSTTNYSDPLRPPPRAKLTKRGADRLATPEQKIRGRGRDTSSAAAAALVSADKPLTSNQLAFAQAWAAGESLTSAAARAGYADAQIGYRLARMPNVLAVYNAEKLKYEAAAQMSRKRVMDGLLEAVEMAKLVSEPASMVSGWREIGKMCGYYEPVKHVLDVNITGDVTVRQLNGMSDADLLKIIKGAETAPTALLERVQE